MMTREERVLAARELLMIPGAYDTAAVSDATGIDTGTETIVQQHFADEVDINTIVRRFGVTRQMPMGTAGGVYGDFTGITDYESAVAAIARVQEGFMKLDPEIRERFDNDPGKLYAFAHELPKDEFVSMLEATPVAPAVPVPAAAPVVVPPASPAV